MRTVALSLHKDHPRLLSTKITTCLVRTMTSQLDSRAVEKYLFISLVVVLVTNLAMQKLTQLGVHSEGGT